MSKCGCPCSPLPLCLCNSCSSPTQGCGSIPDPANQNLKNRIRILLALTKNQFKHLIFFHINQISSDIFMLFFSLKKFKISPENVSKLYFCNFVLVYTTSDPDPQPKSYMSLSSFSVFSLCSPPPVHDLLLHILGKYLVLSPLFSHCFLSSYSVSSLS